MSPKVSAEYMRARRGEILDAATKVFSKKGFHAATLDDIATEAGVSKGAIYIHFESKEAMIDGLSELWETIDEEVFDAADSEPRAIDGLAYAVKATIRRAQQRDFSDSIRLGVFVWSEMLINQAVAESQARLAEVWRRRMYGLANRAKDAGEIGPDHTAESVVTFLGSMGMGLFLGRAWGAEPDVTALESLVDTFIEAVGK